MSNTYYLAHHGIKGQQWGVRNAEWYPIADYEKHLDRLEDAGRARTLYDKRYDAKWKADKYKTKKEHYQKKLVKMESKYRPKIARYNEASAKAAYKSSKVNNSLLDRMFLDEETRMMISDREDNKSNKYDFKASKLESKLANAQAIVDKWADKEMKMNDKISEYTNEMESIGKKYAVDLENKDLWEFYGGCAEDLLVPTLYEKFGGDPKIYNKLLSADYDGDTLPIKTSSGKYAWSNEGDGSYSSSTEVGKFKNAETVAYGSVESAEKLLKEFNKSFDNDSVVDDLVDKLFTDDSWLPANKTKSDIATAVKKNPPFVSLDGDNSVIELWYNDAGLVGGHSLVAEMDPKTGKIRYVSMEG